MADLNEYARTRHLVSGVIDENTPVNIVEHPILGQFLEVVGPDAKPFLPEMHKAPESDGKASNAASKNTDKKDEA